ncbi:alpha/beta hydrolase family protein [Pseudoalteromonas atlantica]|uniref:alpha/beta hydrolase family protein n=1 Tax=Pseudoalteromonas atlantica TaxID=288 RepID=UPI0037354702
MTLNLSAKISNKRVLNALSALALYSVASSVGAAVLDKDNIAFVGPLAEQMQVKPYQTPHHDAAIKNLLPSLQANSSHISVFGEQHKWQALSSVNALTLGGIQALKFTMHTKRFSEGALKLSGIEKATLFIDGVELSATDDTYQLALSNGEHQVLIIAEQVANWNEVSLDFEPKAEHDKITISQHASKTLSAKQLFDAPTISMLSMSPDAEHYIASTRSYNDAAGNQAQITTVLKDQDNTVLYRFESGQPSNVIWSPDNKYVVYLIDGKLKQLNRKNLALNVIAENLEGASGFAFYNNDSLIFTWSKYPETDTSLTKHYRGLQDRWSYARTTSQAYLLDINSGLSKAITEGPLSHSIEDFNSEQGTVLLSRSAHAMEASTHPITELVETTLSTAKQSVLGQFKTFNQAKYTDEGIYVIAGPDFKNGLGRNIPKDMLANNYDGQLYLLDSNGKKAKALSKNFDPAIGQINVLNNGDAVVKVTEQDTQQLYLFDLSKNRFNKLNTKLDVVEQFSVSKNRSPAILLSGTTASSPQQLKYLRISKNRASTLWDSKPLAYANTQIPTLEEFNFTNKQGVEIKGRVYLPTNLDKSKKHPALIYYYGGTSPVSRGFTGRYPFNFWAANGYVVYVVQPTGATGFGQEFSAKHVNAWGEHTAEDIMQGTQALLEQYSFIDKNRLGNLGASYGGFMTMLLATKTDMFSASIAHAGISNITSYWGQGWWGYLYSGEASKGSFPWNNSELYSQRSPVFHADKVTTPLLLLHGDSDTNVPVGESHNMYTALKLLGKDVDLIEYKGADHQIFARDKRFDWWSTMLAYFDKHLKDEPQWWQYLYPEK